MLKRIKEILACLLLIVLIGVGGVIGITTLEPVMNTAPPVTKVSSMCEVADGIAYRAIVQGISVADAVNLYTEIRDLKRMGITEVHFYINSPGGSLFDSLAIYDAIKRLNEEGIVTIADVEGGCMSAAVLIASACSYRTASEHCKFMVHDPVPARGAILNQSDREALELATKQYAELLAENTDLTEEEWLEKMHSNTWFTSEEALEWGLIDEIK